MSEPAHPPATGESPPYPRRFGWPMRLFLALMLFHMTFRSLSVLVPWKEWAKDLRVPTRPAARLATARERAELARKASDSRPHPVRDDTFAALDSVWEFLRPWPGEKTRAWVRSPEDLGKWAFCWACSRLELWENLAGFGQQWQMFSPGASRRKWVTRAKLVYADGTTRVVRNHGDPEDLTRYSHWFEEKILDHELAVDDDEDRADEARGYCNLLAHRYPRNKAGRPLKKIRLFQVCYDLTPPGENARAWLEAQTGPPHDQVFPDFYEYDVANSDGKFLKHRK